MTQNNVFSLELAKQLYYSAEQFPIDFDNAWVWLGYATKQKALKKLKVHFEEGVDFLTKGLKSSVGGRPSDLILLSVDCFKSLGMMAGTEKGKEIRRHFIECERIAKVAMNQQIQSAIPVLPPAQQLAMATDALKALGVELDNPRYAQGLRDWALNLIGVTALPASADERWLGVAERAEELGFGRVGADHSKRVKLGQWVSKCGLQRRREKRLCNGEDREIWCYLVCNELDNAIAGFFERMAA
ncbi:MAG TPA: hypothetical protein V6C63_17735 [Allocoleopsis sp.]